ncbi:AsmA family protein [Phreatobacter stygius]|uniref:AsmA family protein n=1 Tax=Phreatobacter stygius TaxID=1940610 RepID=A0A4D7B5V5_9HYPH|nr:AsmA family protein [Phreatobacter stygius]QCI65778.1 AsmA family protein [Phreatobacter stygius]
MQNTLLAIGIALIIAILSALVGPWLIDWNSHKPLIEAEAGRLFGLPVRIGGDLTIRLLPTIAVDARDVTIGGAESGAKIGRLRGELRVAPLLRGEAALTAVHLRDVDLTLLDQGLPAQGLAAEEITIQNARLSVADAAGGRTLVAERIALTGEARGARGPVRLEGSAVVAGRPMPLQILANFPEAGGLMLRLRSVDRVTGFGVEAEGTTGGPGNPRFDGTIILSGDAGALPWRIGGAASVTASALVFERAEAMLGSGERAARATGSLRYVWGETPALDAIVTARQVDLDRLTDTTGGPAAGNPRTPREVIAALIAAVPALGGSDLPVTVGLDVSGVTIGGALVADLRGDLQSGADGWSAERLAARLPGDSGVELKGRIALRPELGFSGALALQSTRPGLLLSWLDGQATPAGTLDDPIRLSTSMTAEPGRLVLDRLEAATAAGDARGRIALDMPALGRHALTLDLAAEALDLDLLLRLARGAGARLDPATDTRLQLKAAEASFAGVAARGLDVTIASDGNRFDAERLKIRDLAGIGLDLTGRLDGLGGPLNGRLAGRLTADKIDALVAFLARDEATARIGRLLADRAASLGGTDLALSFEAGAGAGAALKLRAQGRVGAAWMHLEAAGTGELASLERLAGQASLVLEAPRADQLLGLATGVPPLGAATATPSRLELVVDRPVNSPISLRGEAQAADTLVNFTGTRGTDGRSNLSVTLASPDIAPILPLAGVPAELAGTVPANLSARIESSEASWRIDGLEGRVGSTTLKAALAGRGRTIIGSVGVGALSFEALASLLTGPAWLIDTEAGRVADASFSRTLLDGLDGEIAVGAESLGLGGSSALTGVTVTLLRQGSKTALRDFRARLAASTVTADVALDRTALATVVQATFGVDRVPLALVFPGAAGAGPLSITLSGDGTSPASLLASLRGEGRHAWPRTTVAGVHPTALRRATRTAEIAQDFGRPLDDAGFAAALTRELAKPVDLGPIDIPLTLSGPRLRAGEAAFAIAGGRVSWSGSADLVAGELAASVRIAPEPPPRAETVPLIALWFDGPLGAAAGRLDADDVSGWLGLRLVEREALRIEMIESDRFERQRQRAFTRLPLRPPEEPAPAAASPDLEPAPAAAAVEPRIEMPESRPDSTPLPLRRPAEPRPPSRIATPPPQPPDLPSVVRRALDGQRATPGEPMSILPPLPPPVEIGPAPGMRR